MWVCRGIANQRICFSEKDFVNKDLVKEINMTIDRFKDHPNEMEDNLPMIYEMIYGDDNGRSYNEEELREIVSKLILRLILLRKQKI